MFAPLHVGPVLAGHDTPRSRLSVSAFAFGDFTVLRRLLRQLRAKSARPGTRPTTSLSVQSLEDRCLLSTWTPLNNPPPDFLGTMMLLPDGTVMAQGQGSNGVSSNWYRLTPSASGSYINGTWSRLASMSLPRLYYASSVLPSDKVFVLGGEYSGASGSQNVTNTGEMYDVLTNTWSPLANFPQSRFGDDPSALLPNGQILAGYISGAVTYLYDPTSNTWTQTGTKLHSDRSDEETWVTLPDNSVLSYDIFSSINNNTFKAQRYIPSTGQWVDASKVDSTNPPSLLSSSNVGYELGPAFLLPNGNVLQLGGNSNTALYNVATNTWSAGPTIPNGLVCDDAPGAELPNGNVIFAADTFFGKNPTSLFQYDVASNTISPLTSLPSGLTNQLNATGAFTGRMLVLPTGQVLYNTGDSQTLYVFTPGVSAPTASQPTITNMQPNLDGTYTLTGTQLTGMSEGASYGDDAEMSTNFPLVQLTGSTGKVYYATTSNWTPGVQTGSAAVTTDFSLPANLPVDTYSLTVSASGIASAPVTFSTAPVDMSAQVVGSTLQITDATGDANVTIKLQATDPTTEQVFNNGSLAGSFAVSSFSSISVTLTGSNNLLTVDATNGDPVPSGGLSYEGGPANQLVVNYAADNANRSIALDSVTPSGDTPFGTITGLAAGVISYEYADTKSLVLNTGTGIDTITLQSAGIPLTVNGGNGGDTFIVATVPTVAVTLNGGNGINTLQGPNVADTWTIKSANGGLMDKKVTFSNFKNLTGGTARDVFKFTAAGSITGSLVGAGGSDQLNYSANGGTAVTVNLQTNTAPAIGGTFSGILSIAGSSATNDLLIGPDTLTNWIVSGVNAGKAGKIGFTGFEELQGGSDVDFFKFTSVKASVTSIDAGAAPAGLGNWLDYSTYAAAVSVDLGADSATGVNGGAAGAIANIQNVHGSNYGSTLTGNSTGNILIGGTGADTITGGSGLSILIGEKGADNIIGGSGGSASGGDILIGGYTTYDSDSNAHFNSLMSILAEWQSADSYDTRFTNIKTGNGILGKAKLSWAQTVKDDGSANILTAAPGTAAVDWFFAGSLDTMNNFETGEHVNNT